MGEVGLDVHVDGGGRDGSYPHLVVPSRLCYGLERVSVSPHLLVILLVLLPEKPAVLGEIIRVNIIIEINGLYFRLVIVSII